MIKQIKFRTQKGSAILIALFVMSTVGVVAFGSTRTYLSELKTTTNITLTDNAYYGAESGLEIALLKYRANPNLQWSNNCDPATSVCTRPSGTSVTDDKPVALPALTNGAVPSVKVEFQGTKLTGTSLKKDDSKQINLNSDLGQSATLSWVWDASCSSLSADSYGLRVSYIDSSGNLDTGQTLDTIYKPSQTSTNLTLANPTVIARIRPLGCDLASYNLVGNSSGSLVDTGITTIDSIGDFAGVSRQLEARIDRSNNQLLGIFDYTLYGNSSIQ